MPTNCLHIIIIIYTSTDEKQNNLEESPQHKVDKQETFANSPLHEACRKGDLNRVSHILSQGLVDINCRDEKHGRTPLMVAAHGGHCRIFDFLINKGAKKSDVDNDCKNVLHWACKGGHAGMVDCVLPHYGIPRKKDMSPLVAAAWEGNRDVFEFLVCTGSNLSNVDSDDNNILHHASFAGKLAIVKYVVSQGSVDINSIRKDRKNPLMLAAIGGHVDVFDFLLSMGGNVSQVDVSGYNILHIATSVRHVEIVNRILSQNLVDVNARDKYGKTAAMIAKDKGELKLYNLLASRGCPVT
ncbi:ankyrin repeat domain-containing protein 50-like [Haliotis asinina]|uniref:ankyrin repeat domain-containing protein 50-like n=1 Tax=Haliotis asinina TaxID=109174 RepID=UPI003531BA3B